MKLLLALCLLSLAVSSVRGAWDYRLGEKTAGISEIRIDGEPIALIPEAAGGVCVEEVVSRDGKPVALPETERFAIETTVQRAGQALLVAAEVTDTRGGDSAANVFYRVPLNVAGWVWHGDPIAGVPVADEEQSQGLYPLAVVSNSETGAGLAIVITPETPCIFQAGCSEERGLYIKAKVGFSDLTSPPSRARICFAVYPVDGEWGMRSTLQEYYRLFPGAYQRRSVKEGLWIFHGKATEVPNPTDFAYHCVGELSESLRHGKLAVDILSADEVRKEKEWGIEIYPYVIPGQREVGFLDHLKGEENRGKKGFDATDLVGVHYTTAEALELLDKLTEKNLTLSQAVQSVPDYKQTVRNSYLVGRDGDVVTRPRICGWADKTVTFPVNPNPFIQGREKKLNIGSVILELCRQWMKGPWDGIYVDSLYRWGCYLNYRREHFPYVRYGLTYGPDGRPVLDNSLEHLTFLDELAKLVRPGGGKIFANGVRNRCFWHAQRLDMAGSEFGTNTSSSGIAFRRAMMYHKPYLGMNHGMGGKEKHRRYLARCFLFGAYGGSDMSYYASEDYPKVRDLYDTYLPIQRRMNQLGWEPVTAARVFAEDVVAERFGDGRVMYFSLYRVSGDAREAGLEVDCARLELSPEKVAVTDPVSGKTLEAVPVAGGKLRIQGIPLSTEGIGVVRVEIPSAQAAQAPR